MTIDPLYADNHLLAVVKPAGILSQADSTGDPDMLTLGKDWIRRRHDKPGAVYLGLVHRLDRPASGVMVLARTSKAARRLSRQFRARTVRKRYVAVVEGVLEGAGSWTDYIRKLRSRPEITAADADGAARASLSWTARRLDDPDEQPLSLAQIELETGRPHQIRLQFSSRGYPVLGDVRYGARGILDGRNIALHALSITIDHPTKQAPMTWCALPPRTWPAEAGRRCRAMFDERCLNDPAPAPDISRGS